MLPWTSGRRSTNHNGLFSRPSPNAVRYDPVSSPVSPTDHVAGPTYTHPRRGLLEKRVEVRVRHEFRTPLRAAIRVVTTHNVRLPVPPIPLIVAIYLVTCNKHSGLNPGPLTNTLEKIHHPHHIGFKRQRWVRMRVQDKRLSSKMKD